MGFVVIYIFQMECHGINPSYTVKFLEVIELAGHPRNIKSPMRTIIFITELIEEVRLALLDWSYITQQSTCIASTNH
jgi:hypothetical protein